MAPPVVTTEQLAAQLRRLGVEPGMTLLVHTAFREVRPVEGGPLGLVEALGDVLGPSGTLVMPSMTGSRSAEPYDPASTPTRGMGIVAETFWRLPGVVRSDHPTSAFAARGPCAERIVAPQPLTPPHGPDSPVGRVRDLDGRVLLLGVGHDANTTVHLAEVLAGARYRRAKWCTLLVNGEAVRREYEEIDHCCRSFGLLDVWLRARGLQAEGVVGHARARLARSRDVVDVAVAHLRSDPTCFLCLRGSGCEQCDEAWSSLRRP